MIRNQDCKINGTVFPRVLLFFSVCIAIGCCKLVLADTPIGWAVFPAHGVESTVGGGNGDVVTARTAKEFANYVRSEIPLTIRVEGTLDGNGKTNVASNKTILGVGSSATLTNTELNLSGVSNIVIRNLHIKDARDAIAMRRSHHVWVDHCDLSACDDGLLDITNQSDYVTVSWTRFSNHHKTMLINSGTSQPEDMGTLKTTIHHCWYDGSDTRNPRVGYGKVHIFNCLYNGNDYGIGLHSLCRVLAERNYFNNTKNSIRQMYRPDPKDIHHGFCESVDNIFKNCTGSQDDEGISFPVSDHYYHYDFAMHDVKAVPAMVKEKVGPAAAFGTLGPLPIPGNGAINVTSKPVLRWTKSHDAKKYIVFFGENHSPARRTETSEQTFTPDKLKPKTVYYWRVDRITDKGVIPGDLWRFQTE
ncbi:pectate lyase [bacterium]|nr:pectate lyase [bacterium]